MWGRITVTDSSIWLRILIFLCRRVSERQCRWLGRSSWIDWTSTSPPGCQLVWWWRKLWRWGIRYRLIQSNNRFLLYYLCTLVCRKYISTVVMPCCPIFMSQEKYIVNNLPTAIDFFLSVHLLLVHVWICFLFFFLVAHFCLSLSNFFSFLSNGKMYIWRHKLKSALILRSMFIEL